MDYMTLYPRRFTVMSESSEIMQFQATIATNCKVLTHHMNISYVDSLELPSSFFHCVTFTLRVLIIF
jgi:hypothetical protein